MPTAETAVLQIGSTSETLAAMPDPALEGMTVTLQDLDSESSTRTANGTMKRDRIVGGADAKRKIELEFPALTPAQASTLLQAISGVFFYVRYPDPYTGAFRTAQFYAGDRSAPVYTADVNGNVMWNRIRFTLIER